MFVLRDRLRKRASLVRNRSSRASRGTDRGGNTFILFLLPSNRPKTLSEQGPRRKRLRPAVPSVNSIPLPQSRDWVIFSFMGEVLKPIRWCTKHMRNLRSDSRAAVAFAPAFRCISATVSRIM